MTCPTNPAVTLQQATNLVISAANDLYEVINGLATEEVTLCDSQVIPTLRKALLDNFYFLPAIPYVAGVDATEYNQLYTYTDYLIYAPAATVSNPITAPANPLDSGDWQIFSGTGSSIEQQPRVVADGVTTVYDSPASSLQPARNFIVTLDGVKQDPVTDYDVLSNGDIEFTVAPEEGVAVDIIYFKNITIVDNQTGLYAQQAQDAADEAEASALSAASNANFKGEWSTLTGAYSKGITVSESGIRYLLKVDLADITTSQPSLNPNDWDALNVHNELAGISDPNAHPASSINLDSGETVENALRTTLGLTFSSVDNLVNGTALTGTVAFSDIASKYTDIDTQVVTVKTTSFGAGTGLGGAKYRIITKTKADTDGVTYWTAGSKVGNYAFLLSGGAYVALGTFVADAEMWPEQIGIDGTVAADLDFLDFFSGVVNFNGTKTYKIANKDIDISKQVWKGNGATLDASDVADDVNEYGIRFYNSGSRDINSIPYLSFDYNWSGFVVIGPSRNFACKGMYFYSPEGGIGGTNIGPHTVAEFGDGHAYYTNAYIITHFGANVLRCNNNHVVMYDGGSNYGENIKYVGGVIGTSNGTAVHNINANGTIILDGVSVDYTAKLIYAEKGMIDVSMAHIEFDNGINALSDIPFEAGNHESAYINIMGGRILSFTGLTQDYLFKHGTDSKINVDGVNMLKTVCLQNSLDTGTGEFTIKNTKVIVGSGNTTVTNLTSVNNMVDGGFEQSGDPRGVYIYSDTATISDKLSGTNIVLSTDATEFNSGSQSLKAVKTFGGGSNAGFRIYSPIETGQQLGWELYAKVVSGSGTATITARYFAFEDFESYGSPKVIKVDDVPGAVRTIDAAVHTTWTRFPMQLIKTSVPSWATHVVLEVNMFNANTMVLNIDDVKVCNF